MSLTKKTNTAFTLIEVLLAVFIFTIFSTGVVYVSIDTIDRDAKVELQNESLRYAQEGLEATRAIRSEDYWDLVTGEYGLNFTSDTWSFVASPETIDDFYQRTITIEDVQRDPEGNISEIGTLDPNTKKIISKVTWDWKGLIPKTVELETYLSNWTGDDWIKTTCTEWTAGTFSTTQTIETADPPAGDCALMLEVVEGPGDFFTSADVGSHGNDVAIDGTWAYMAATHMHEGFFTVDISDINNPEVAEDVDIGGKGRSVLKVGNYAYLGVENGSKGLAIVDVSDPNEPDLTSTFGIGGYGNRMDMSGNYLFAGVNSNTSSLKIVNVSNPASPATTATMSLGTYVNVVKISGNYAYLGTSNASGGFKVVDITNPASPSLVYTLNVDSSVNGIDIIGSYAYIGTGNNLKIVSIADPLFPAVIGTFPAGAKVQDVSVDSDYAYVALDQNNPGMAAINITESPSMSFAYARDIEGKASSVESDGTNVFFTIDVANMGLVIIDVGTGSLATIGNYISSILDAGSEDVRYNYFDAEVELAAGGSAIFQIRTASTEGGLSSATWVGPNGTPDTYYHAEPIAITLAPSASGKRYLQVKVYLGSDGVNSTQVESITVNYTP